MGAVRILEFDRLGFAEPGMAQIPQFPPLVEQTAITLSGSSQASAAFSANTKYVLLATDSAGACCFSVGGAPTATTANLRLGNEVFFFFGVTAGHKVALIQTT